MVNGIGSLQNYQQLYNLTSQQGGQVGNQPVYTAQQKPADDEGLHKAVDEILPNDYKTKLKVNVEQAGLVPGYVKRGFKGDPDANFFEFLKIAKIPYYIGGPMLAWCFAKGGSEATPRTRKALAGVALYYLAPVVADLAISLPLKAFRGVDVNHPYRDIVGRRAQTPDGVSPKKKEYHKVFESVDFTRWDLLYRTDDEALKNPELVNDNYNKIARKVGIDEDANSPDSATKPYITKMIIQSRAWKTALMIPLVVMGLGIAAQDCWNKPNLSYAWLNIKRPFTMLENGETKWHLKRGLKGAVNQIGSLVNETLIQAVKDLWTGHVDDVAGKVKGKYFGKVTILTTAALMIAANINILLTSSAKKKQVIDAKLVNTTKQNLRNISILNFNKPYSSELGGNK